MFHLDCAEHHNNHISYCDRGTCHSHVTARGLIFFPNLIRSTHSHPYRRILGTRSARLPHTPVRDAHTNRPARTWHINQNQHENRLVVWRSHHRDHDLAEGAAQNDIRNWRTRGHPRAGGTGSKLGKAEVFSLWAME
jgi:hypothetical protein